jgi:hypothetical protein
MTGSKDDRSRVQVDISGELQEVCDIARDDHLIVLESVPPDDRVACSGQAAVRHVDGGDTHFREVLDKGWREVLVDEELHPSPRMSRSRFGRPWGRPSATNILANSTSSASSAG